jgi:hypothetical protein
MEEKSELNDFVENKDNIYQEWEMIKVKKYLMKMKENFGVLIDYYKKNEKVNHFRFWYIRKIMVYLMKNY